MVHSIRRRPAVPGRRECMIAWLLVGAVFGALTVASRVAVSPLDDPDPARQRPGYLDDSGSPYIAVPLAPNLPPRASRAVLLFTRPALEPALMVAIQADPGLTAAARVVVVVCGDRPLVASSSYIAVLEEGAACPAARLYRMRSPRDGGAPVGYAIVSSSGLVRYTTLDPGDADHLSEVVTLTRSVP